MTTSRTAAVASKRLSLEVPDHLPIFTSSFLERHVPGSIDFYSGCIVGPDRPGPRPGVNAFGNSSEFSAEMQQSNPDAAGISRGDKPPAVLGRIEPPHIELYSRRTPVPGPPRFLRLSLP